ncbi:MAG: DUF2959 family protein [Planctomycetota bacterium]
MDQRPWIGCVFLAGLVVVAGLSVGCRSLYYRAQSALGNEKRDLLVDAIEDVRDEQQDAKEEFTSALDRLLALTGGEITDLKQAYDKLRSDYEDAADAAADVRGEIAEVKRVAGDLFVEWEARIEENTDADQRAIMKRQLSDSKQRYATLESKMDAAAARMAPVLEAFSNQVIFLESSLNAQAIASLEGKAVQIESDVAALIEQMNASIAEADAFIASMQQ